MADSIYWTQNELNDYTIRGAPLSGGGTPGTLYSSAQGVNIAFGLAIDPTADRIYWANYGDNTIRRASLAGGGTPDTLYDSSDGVSSPTGAAIHPAAGRIYWTQTGDHTIRRASLAGSGAPDTLYGPAEGVFNPAGLAIDPAAGRIYWRNGDATIRVAPLAGAAAGGTGTPLYTLAQADGGSTVAIDPAAGRIYWTGYSAGTIRSAPLAGGGTPGTLYASARYPAGLAIDPTPLPPALAVTDAVLDTGKKPLVAGWWFGRALGWIRDLFPGSGTSPAGASSERIYLANSGDNTVRWAPLDGSGTLDTLYGSAQGVSIPSALAVLRAPVAAGAPTIGWSLIFELAPPPAGMGFGPATSGPLDQQLSCSRGTWAADVPGSALYRAPQSFDYQWRLNGTDIGANLPKYTPSAPGSYTCRVTATNRAGSAAQTSAAVAVA